MQKIILVLFTVLLLVPVCVAEQESISVDEAKGLVTYRRSNYQEVTEKVAEDQVDFMIMRVGEKNCIPIADNACIYPLQGSVDYFVKNITQVGVFDRGHFLGKGIGYNGEDKGVYAINKQQIHQKIDYQGRPHWAQAKSEYYRIGQGSIVRGRFKPVFNPGTWFSCREIPPGFRGDTNHRYVHVSGDLTAPDFVSYDIVLEDGTTVERIP
ncbi:MAG: hypothetical protein JW714_05645 [Candidatus Omnitrophica bacterium]|nr:hypothetical protein [Candidatus Omnitrophota bacterium]